jgi:high-affinity iron transporter
VVGLGRQNAPLVATIASSIVLAVLGAWVLSWSNSSTGDPPSEAARADIVIATGSCAAGWNAPPSGNPTFSVRNDSDDPYEVLLVAVDTQQTYAKIEVLGARTQRPLRVALPPGRYQWQCGNLLGPATISDVRTVTGAPVDAHPAPPENETANVVATVAYRERVHAGLQRLARLTSGLVAATNTGDRLASQAAWLRAHLAYERLGAAYDTFGEFAGRIDGRDSGFHRVERLLWSNARMPAVAAAARALDNDVSALVRAFPTQPTGANDISRRVHEILENTLQFELTGATDNGSHTNLATARANVDGTAMALDVLAPELRRVDPALLKRATTQLGALGRLLDGYQRGDAWRPLSQLTRAQRRQLDAATSSLLESLSPVPDLLEVDPNAQP